ncbi:thiamine-phosphate kinase [Pyruvatibacter mobilis]|uniref:thiamine-phosphate kinase n=1 Tax=Pyruvatibacter mobilis TaxID=1712261 RepID=UPI003BAF39BA
MASGAGRGDDEFALIARLFAPLSEGDLGLNLKDDVGFVPGTDKTSCVTSDMIVAGVHFLPDDPADLIARKLVRVNISDIAAKGARATGVLLSAAFSASRGPDWIETFAHGLANDLTYYGVPLIGGDTVRTPGPDSFSLTAFGQVTGRHLVKRQGAVPGDGLYVTGTIGDAGLGLKLLRDELGTVPLGRRQPLVGRYHLPEPRHLFGAGLATVASASLDVSDGLIADAGHLAEASAVGLDISFDRVPLSTSAARLVKGDPSLHQLLLGMGDDFEILFTAPANSASRLIELSGDTDTPVTRIGEVVEDACHTVRVLDSAGAPLEVSQPGYTHF